MRCKMNCVAVAIVAALLLVALPTIARSQEQPTAPSGPQTMESLKKMIDDMGVTYRESKNDKGQVVRYIVTVAGAGRNWLICAEISPNQENLWLYANLAKVPDANAIPRQVLTDMLTANEKIGPSYFAIDGRSNFFVLFHPLTNTGITPRMLRSRLDLVASHVARNENLWNPSRWSTSPSQPSVTPTITPAVQKLIDELASANELVRLQAAKELGRMGAAAKGAIPALQKLLQDPDLDVRGVATNAIARIQESAPPVPSTSNLVGSTWEGTESLSGFGKLTFRLEAAGKAVMIDASSTVNGDWAQDGSKVTITFKNCVYQGTIQGQVLSGTARFTSGSDANWTFSVTRAGINAPQEK